uniref:LRAT domain-containing protein n=1 Tax=Anolis carolinensis TaxID=28377 RepID=R4GB80_ANOCA|nr:PREDICTED: retinoic acid receptor responder protein 3 [Anolis carolinensis]|eukprot:XP_003229593.1 PREDICTED: retinoic acid receptor responder protein 3 [Anolis carolinensis]
MGQEESAEKREPEPGDIVEFHRVGYRHYGIAVGNGYVVHLTSAEPEPPGYHFSSSSGRPKAKVKKEHLSIVAQGNKYWVNNINDHKMKPRKPEVIVSLAEAMVGKEMDYNLLKSNCEHFATMLRYGDPQSKQADAGIITTTVGTALGAAVVIGSAVTARRT